MPVIEFPNGKQTDETNPPKPFGYIEPAVAPEFFCTDLAAMHDHGTFTRLTFTSPSSLEEGDLGQAAEVQNIVIVKLVVPSVLLKAMCEKIMGNLPLLAGFSAFKIDPPAPTVE